MLAVLDAGDDSVYRYDRDGMRSAVKTLPCRRGPTGLSYYFSVASGDIWQIFLMKCDLNTPWDQSLWESGHRGTDFWISLAAVKYFVVDKPAKKRYLAVWV